MENGNDVVMYTKEDFTDGTAPYEEVYSLKENKFEFNRAINKMSDVARAVGVRNFKKLFEAYCDVMRRTSNLDYVPNASNFEGQEIELDTGRWIADDSGITKGGTYEDIIACVHPIMPVERLVNIDTGIEKLRISYRKGNQWRSMIFEKRQLASANSIVALSDYGIAVTSENAKHLVQYIHDVENLNYEKIPEHNSVSRLGWIGQNDFSPYVDDLIYDGSISFQHFYDSVSRKGKAEKWIDFVRDIRKEDNIPTKIILAASFASVLVKPCNCLPFFVHLWNGSGNGKTVALMLAASVWANPQVGEYIHTFDSTDVGQELSAGFVNSLPLILDELQIQKDRKDFDKTIYKLSEGVGRMRGAKTGGLQKMQTWKNCILTNGEAPITSSHSGSGAVNRIIEINTEGTNFFKDSKKVADFITNNYGHAGKMFIEELANEETMELAKTMQKDFYNKLSGKDITEKQTLAASLVLAADALIDMLIFKDGNGLCIDEMEQFLSTHSEVSADERALDWLMDWITRNSKRFKEINDTSETWGKVTVGAVYVIRDVFNGACVDNGYNPTSFLSWLKRSGRIEVEGRAYTKRTSINGIKCQCVVLKTEDDVLSDLQKIPENEQVSF